MEIKNTELSHNGNITSKTCWIKNMKINFIVSHLELKTLIDLLNTYFEIFLDLQEVAKIDRIPVYPLPNFPQ